MKATILIAGISFLFSVFIFAQKNDYSFKESHEIKTPATLKVSVSDGFVNVYPSKNNKAEVFFIVKKGNNLQKVTREELDPSIRLVINKYPGELEITVKHQNSNWSNWENTYSVSCEIYTPIETSCDLRTSDGDIILKGLNGNHQCRTSDGDVYAAMIDGQINAITSDGDVEVYNIMGNATLQTSDGDIKAETVEGDAKFVTSDGDVDLKNIIDLIEMRTSDGDINFSDCSGSVFAQTSDGDIQGNLLVLKNKLTLLTSDGDIEATIPQGLSFNVKLKGSDLDIPLVDFSGKTEEHMIQGTVRGGGIPVELLALDGRVSLQYK